MNTAHGRSHSESLVAPVHRKNQRSELSEMPAAAGNKRDGHDCGHASVPHTADLRIEAWGPSREDCIAEAVRGLVESFAHVSRTGNQRVTERHLTADSDADLLAAAVDEIIYWVDAEGQIPAALDVSRAADGGIDLNLRTVQASATQIIGAVPKAAAMSALTCAPDSSGQWSCAVTVDV
jgi:SHS2 domain-containing protein